MLSGDLPKGLSKIPTHTIEALLRFVQTGKLTVPLRKIELSSLGYTHLAESIVEAIGSLDAKAVVVVLAIVLAERKYRPPPRLELVWSGPEAHGTVSRDTSLELRRLFESATRSVLIGGYSFDSSEILEPLYKAMRERQVTCRLFMEIEGHAKSKNAKDVTRFATEVIDYFFHKIWTFGFPRPEVYYDPRTATPGPPWASLHAKCVVVDETKTLVTSANFTERGQSRNIEVGAMIDDPTFAQELVAQWNTMISAGVLKRY